jgi:hypothetical protein
MLSLFAADSVEEYLKRKKAISSPKDIVDFLKLLIQRKGDNLLIYDGSTKTKTVGTKASIILFCFLIYWTKLL